jgi:hypothetical protein
MTSLVPWPSFAPALALVLPPLFAAFFGVTVLAGTLFPVLASAYGTP